MTTLVGSIFRSPTVSRAIASPVQDRIAARAEVIRRDGERKLWRQTDQLFALLLVLQWLAGIAIAVWLSPWAWEGLSRRISPHVSTAIALGGVIASLPLGLVIFKPGETITRYVIAVAQMLHSALLIHLCGGRIESHFHIFGSLAFLSFYRDWRVLVPATLVVALDHMLRSVFWPQSVFGVDSAEAWRWSEHAAWVIFEDIFLVWACVRGASEMAALAIRQAELELANERVEAEVARQTERLESVSQELITTARKAGMAEIATGVLHNVGNVLNSVNVSASVLNDRVRNSEVTSLGKVATLLGEHRDNMAAFLATDSRAQHVGPFLADLSECLLREHGDMEQELHSMLRGIEHIKAIVSAQQENAKASAIVRVRVRPGDVLAEAVAMTLAISPADAVQVETQFAEIGPIAIDKNRVLQVLINLLTNAKKSVAEKTRASGAGGTLRASTSVDGDRLRFAVADDGVGIAPENLSRVFMHGFTTRADGHGFGLHSAANAANEMGGSLRVASDGRGRGATFTLDLPLSAQTNADSLLTSRGAN